MESQPLIADKEQVYGDAEADVIPKAPFADALHSERDPSRWLPQAIAHRGYKAAWPENTMAAFRGALEGAGAHAIETDTHLSADGVVVLSHDATLKRCFGLDQKISDCSWEYLSTVETLREPRQPMPRLQDVLEYLAEPGMEKKWLLLDIKIDDAAGELLPAIAKVIAKVPSSVPWDQRIVLGCWNATFIQLARKLMPTFPLAHISFTVLYARHFFRRVPGLGFNMFQQSLVGPYGARFMRDARCAGRQMFAWTVNTERAMEWCIAQNDPGRRRGRCGGRSGNGGHQSLQGIKFIDGVITDDPKLYLEVCERWEDELDGKRQRRRVGLAQSIKNEVRALAMWAMLQAVVTYFWFRHRFISRRLDLIEDV